MPVTSMGWVHFVMALAAIAVGGAVALSRKGTVRHRNLGRVYAWLMVGVNATAFSIYGLFGRPGPFHAAAFVSLVTIIAGWIPVRRRKPGQWVEIHARWMAWSYVGLLAAAAAETLSRLPDSPFWWMVAGASLAVVAIGAVVINRRLPVALAPYRRAAARRAAAEEAGRAAAS